MGGKPLLEIYENSMLKFLTNMVPSYEWLPWKFASVPKHFWDSKENQKWFLESARKELGIKEMQDWYDIPTRVVPALPKKR